MTLGDSAIRSIRTGFSAHTSNDLEHATRSLTAELADLKATLAELRLALASDRSTPLELPPLRPHVN